MLLTSSCEFISYWEKKPHTQKRRNDGGTKNSGEVGITLAKPLCLSLCLCLTYAPEHLWNWCDVYSHPCVSTPRYPASPQMHKPRCILLGSANTPSSLGGIMTEANDDRVSSIPRSKEFVTCSAGAKRHDNPTAQRENAEVRDERVQQGHACHLLHLPLKCAYVNTVDKPTCICVCGRAREQKWTEETLTGDIKRLHPLVVSTTTT